MKNNYTTFIADLEKTDCYGTVVKWTDIVYKTSCNKLFVVGIGRELIAITEKHIKHIYG